MKVLALLIATGLAVAGCGGGSGEPTAALQTGVYEWELTEQYLLENGIAAQRYIKPAHPRQNRRGQKILIPLTSL